jgi:hypothetical protein
MSKIVAKLVKRLRSSDCCDAPMCNCDEAAAEITRLREEVERLRAALTDIATVRGLAADLQARAALTPYTGED